MRILLESVAGLSTHCWIVRRGQWGLDQKDSKKAKYSCDECDFVGQSKVTMEVHIGKCHSEKFDCGLCDIETQSLQNLETHLKHSCEAYQC